MRRLSAILLLVAACGGSAVAGDTSPPSTDTAATAATSTTATTGATTPSSTTTTTATSTTTAPSDTTTTVAAGPETIEFIEGLGADVYAPDEVGPWPVVVLIHGGSWFGGNRRSMTSLALGLADRGMVVYNASYRTIARGGSFPATVDDVACAVAFAAADSVRLTTSSSAPIVVGHSAGAHLAALASLAPGTFGKDCPWGEAAPGGFVGLAGWYNTDLLGFLLEPFFGTDIREDPGPWEAGNPLTYADAPPNIPYLLIQGDTDELVPLAAGEEMAQALTEAGADVTFEVLLNAGHADVIDPRETADLIAAFVAGQ